MKTQATLEGREVALPTLSLSQRVNENERKRLRAIAKSKREYLSQHLGILFSNTNPTNLWNSIVRHRYGTHPSSPRKDGEPSNVAIESYEDLQLDYEGFRAVVFELLFATTVQEHERESPATRQYRQQLFFAHPFLSPATFLSFSCPNSKTVPAVPLYAFVAKRLLLFRLRVELELVASAAPPLLSDRRASSSQGPSLTCPPSASSPLSNGLTQEDLETFIGDLIPHLRLIRDVPPWMLPYYLCHASRKFFFMCDSRRTGALPIDVVMKSDVFAELLRMFESDPRDAFMTFPEQCPVEVPATLLDPAAEAQETVPGTVVEFENDGNDASDVYTVRLAGRPQADGSSALDSGEAATQSTVKVRREKVYYSSAAADVLGPEQMSMDNWFSLPLMCRIYEHFTSLDQDEDGVLTAEELAHYSNDSFTRLAIERTFECHVPQSSGRHIMDYKTYLNFVIATEHAATRPAAKYIWQILDLECTRNRISVTTLRCFCKELAHELTSHELMLDISAESILSEIIDMVNPEWHEWVTFDDLERSGQQATVLPILLSYRNFFAYDCREQTAVAASDEFAEAADS